MDFPPSARPSRLGINDLLTPISSPKRKRDCESDSEYDSPRASPMRFRTELPSRPRSEQVSSPTSPRSKVSRQLHALKLNKPDLAFSSPIAAFGQDQSSMDSSSGSWNTSSPPTESEPESVTVLRPAIAFSPAPEAISNPRIVIPPPPTPTLAPDSSIPSIPLSPMPLPSPLPGHSGDQLSEAGSSSASEHSPARSRRRSSPPPPQISSSDLTWTASEITGHDPTDPTDDGYGINGIGFRPTPAMAYARTQRRKQQVAEWKTREAKEARQRRLDRRKKLSVEMDRGGGVITDADEKRKVRFADA